MSKNMDYNEQVEAAKAKFLAAIPEHPEILTTDDVCELPDEARAVVHGLGLSGQQAQFALGAARAQHSGSAVCPKCGYTTQDQATHRDHHLCKGSIPEAGDGGGE